LQPSDTSDRGKHDAIDETAPANDVDTRASVSSDRRIKGHRDLSLAEFLTNYGYAAVFVGTFAEGESMLLLGGYAAHRGFLELPWVILTAFCAAVTADQTYFYIGRRHGARFLARSPRLTAKTATALRLVATHSVLTVLLMRFLWGLRIALPLAIGMSGMSALRYLALDLAAAALWATIFGGVGFGATQLLEHAIANLHQYDGWIASALLLGPIIVLALRWWWRKGGSLARS
jgi:membrane protein DedA with SNARE-associated domain